MEQKAPDVAEVLAGESRRTRGRRFVVWGIVAALAVAAALLGWWWFSGASQSTAKRYVTEAATRADIRETVVATGTLEPTGEAEVSSTISGTIASVDVDANDRVSKGQILARLEMGDLEAGLARAIAMVESQRANLLAAEANLADADAALKRTQALSAGQSVSVRELELAGTAAKRAQAQLAVAQAQLRGAEADLQGARNDYAKSCICSPIDGVVMEVNADVGQSITTSSLGKSLFSIAEDLSRLDLLVDIDEADIGKVLAGRQRHLHGRGVAGPAVLRRDPADPLRAGGRRRGGELPRGAERRQCRPGASSGHDGDRGHRRGGGEQRPDGA